MVGITCLSMANRGVQTRTGSQPISEIFDLVNDRDIFHLYFSDGLIGILHE